MPPDLGPDPEAERLGSTAGSGPESSDWSLAPTGARVSLALSAADIVGVWDADLAAGLVYGDANFARIYGVDPEPAARGMPRGTYVKNIHPDDLAEVRAEMDRLFAGAPDYINEHRIFRDDGSLRWVLTRGRLVKDKQGTPIRFAGLSVDITERRRAEARQAFLLDLADRLRALTDPRAILQEGVASLGRHLGASRVGYGQVQPDDATIVIETNYARGVAPLAGAFPMAGFGAHNITLHRQGLTIALDDVMADPLNAAAFASSGIRSVVSVPLIRDGRFRASLFVSHRDPHVWAPDEVCLIGDVAARLWDAIERARAEESLRQLNASLERQVEQRQRERDLMWRLAPVVMVVGDPLGCLLDVNPAWTDILGWSAAETVGRDVMDFVVPEVCAPGAAGLERLFKDQPVLDAQRTFLTKSGERRIIAWTSIPEGGRLYGYGRDVTDQVTAEDRLRQAQKMEAVGQLTGGLAHDFNNLLTGIMGSLDVIKLRLNQGRLSDIDRYIEGAQGAARRAGALTHRLLAFSRRQTLDPKPTNVNDLIAGMEDLIRRSVGSELEIAIAPAADLWTTRVDPHQLENALLNLCINARDAMPEGGRLTIETANQTLDAGAARPLELAEGQYVRLCVTDTGSGMTPEVMRRAFDPFFTTKPMGAGTGLGLSMIYGFARQSGGQVQMASERGRGTAMSLLLPRHIGKDQGAASAATADTSAPAGRGEKVLLVDDDAAVRLSVSGVLEDLGYSIIEAADSTAGLRLLQSAAPIDLLITDLSLPGKMNGRGLADAGRGLRPELRVLFITGHAENSVIGNRRLDAGMDILTKPFALAALANRIKRLMNATITIDATAATKT